MIITIAIFLTIALDSQSAKERDRANQYTKPDRNYNCYFFKIALDSQSAKERDRRTKILNLIVITIAIFLTIALDSQSPKERDRANKDTKPRGNCFFAREK